MQLEVIIQDGTDAKRAEELGVDRLEFVSAMQEGGLTPSYGALKQVFASTTIPVYTMVRPHGHHFMYDDKDQAVIHADIENIISLGGNKIVTGALTEEKTIDEQFLQAIIKRWPDLIITFHRAFDKVADPIEAYRTLTNYQDHVKYILTSGGEADCVKGAITLQKLVQLSKELGGPEIMPGSGLNPDNIADIHQQVQANYYHFGSAVRIDHSFAKSYDPEQIKAIRQVIKRKE